ncbi:MAG: putative DNA binding domain-containing protein [Planctomycetes bacterium]|nr:putative DNA binding domain-containing protein [Planctomycetota bacterium]
MDKKSLRVLTGTKADLEELAKDCVAFANSTGGRLLIGIEKEADEPPAGQHVDDSWLERLPQRISQLTLNVGTAAQKVTAENGGECLELRVFRNAQSIASTSDGRYFIRASDESRPLLPDELSRLMNDKTAYVWEALTTKRAPRSQADPAKEKAFLESIRASERVSPFVKEKPDTELLDYYLLAKGEYLTSLGILWIGRREDRATLLYAPAIQFIKYDETGRKVNKLLWDDFSLNPQELIEVVWSEVPDWRESYEIPDGLFRKSVPHYDEVVVRELLANALVHRPYTQRGDIFLNLYPDRLEVHNPGLLPLGVTPQNILHTTVKRNEHLAKVFYDLKLMEREGSGYDRMYEVLLASGKPLPQVREGDDRVAVTVEKRIIDPVIVDFVAKADQAFQLSQRERISLGLLAQHESLTARELAKLLELRQTADLPHWLGNLIEAKLIRTRGRTKGMEYHVDPKVLRELDFKGLTTLKGIEEHRLRELILRDLEIYQDASLGEIHRRIGTEIHRRRVQRALCSLVEEGQIGRKGNLRWTRYLWTKTPEKKANGS